MTASLRGRASRISTRTSQSRDVIRADPSPRSTPRWTFPPIVLLALAAYLVVYGARWRRSRAAGRRAGRRAGWRAASWGGGVLLLAVALVSPVDRLGEQMASWHMVQHLLIADLAPILLILGLTKWILRPATRRIHRIERAAGPFGHPAFGVVAYVAAMWLWHVPALYDAALAHTGGPRARAPTFFAAGSLYWWHLLSPIRSRLRMPRPRAGRLHGLHEAARRLPRHRARVLQHRLSTSTPGRATAWGLTPLEDQNVAGLFMALEQSIVMGIALAWLFARMLAESEAEEQRAERYA